MHFANFAKIASSSWEASSLCEARDFSIDTAGSEGMPGIWIDNGLKREWYEVGSASKSKKKIQYATNDWRIETRHADESDAVMQARVQKKVDDARAVSHLRSSPGPKRNIHVRERLFLSCLVLCTLCCSQANADASAAADGKSTPPPTPPSRGKGKPSPTTLAEREPPPPAKRVTRSEAGAESEAESLIARHAGDG